MVIKDSVDANVRMDCLVLRQRVYSVFQKRRIRSVNQVRSNVWCMWKTWHGHWRERDNRRRWVLWILVIVSRWVTHTDKGWSRHGLKKEISRIPTLTENGRMNTQGVWSLSVWKNGTYQSMSFSYCFLISSDSNQDNVEWEWWDQVTDLISFLLSQMDFKITLLWNDLSWRGQKRSWLNHLAILLVAFHVGWLQSGLNYLIY